MKVKCPSCGVETWPGVKCRKCSRMVPKPQVIEKKEEIEISYPDEDLVDTEDDETELEKE